MSNIIEERELIPIPEDPHYLVQPFFEQAARIRFGIAMQGIDPTDTEAIQRHQQAIATNRQELNDLLAQPRWNGDLNALNETLRQVCPLIQPQFDSDWNIRAALTPADLPQGSGLQSGLNATLRWRYGSRQKLSTVSEDEKAQVVAEVAAYDEEIAHFLQQEPWNGNVRMAVEYILVHDPLGGTLKYLRNVMEP